MILLEHQYPKKNISLPFREKPSSCRVMYPKREKNFRDLKNINNKYMDLLKNNSSELSFKGSFNIDETLKLVDKCFADHILESIHNIIKQTGNKYFRFYKDKLSIKPRTALDFFTNSLLYPFKEMPLDMLDFLGKGLKKVGYSGFYDSAILQKHRSNSNILKNVDEITGFFSKIDGILPKGCSVEDLSPEKQSEIRKYLINETQKMFNTDTGHYDASKERALNRIVSGVIPAFFLAIDAYNLSRLINDKPNEANTEYKTRFQQELMRVFATAYLQLTLLGVFSKFVNKSKWTPAILSLVVVLFTEITSRKMLNKPVTFINKENAEKLYNEKQQKQERTANKVGTDKKINIESSTQNDNVEKVNKEEQKDKGLFSLSVLGKWISWSIGLGIAFTYALKYKGIENLYNNFTNFFKSGYNKLTTKDVLIPKEDLEKLISKLQKLNFREQAEVYQGKYKDQLNNEQINLGKISKKTSPIINFIIGPFKFLWASLSFPYRLFRLLFELIDPNTKGFFIQSGGNKKKSLDAKYTKSISILIEKMKNNSDREFLKYLNSNMLEFFNEVSKSGISNADLAKLVKIVSSSATSWFLIADNYNMVMINSKGDDKPTAVQKGKERALQRISGIFYQMLLIDLFNTTFKSFYHSSLIGMSVITAICTLCQEVITRWAIGMPIKRHSRDEIINIENKNNSQTGVVGDYYRLMSRITGKSQLSQRMTKTVG